MLHAEIDFSDEIACQIHERLNKWGGTVEQFVQQAVARELQRQQAQNLDSFFANLQPLESFTDIDPVAYIDDIRSHSRLNNE